MILDPTMTLMAALATTVAASQPTWKVDYEDYNNAGELAGYGSFVTTMAGTTYVTTLPAPSEHIYSRHVLRATYYNADTASTTPLIVIDVSGTKYTELRYANLATLKSLIWEKSVGWSVP